MACPVCKGNLSLKSQSKKLTVVPLEVDEKEHADDDQKTQESQDASSGKDELICRACNLAYPITDGIPVMLENKARVLSNEERL